LFVIDSKMLTNVCIT